MHLYIATKGIKHDVDNFITQLQGKYLPIKWRAKKEDEYVNASVQLSVRPIQLWEIGYPKECHDIVAATILGKDYQIIGGNDGKKGAEHKWIYKFVWFFRKLMHLKPIPKFNLDNQMPICRQNMTIIGLGTKDDYIMESGVEGI